MEKTMNEIAEQIETATDAIAKANARIEALKMLGEAHDNVNASIVALIEVRHCLHVAIKSL